MQWRWSLVLLVILFLHSRCTTCASTLMVIFDLDSCPNYEWWSNVYWAQCQENLSILFCHQFQGRAFADDCHGLLLQARCQEHCYCTGPNTITGWLRGTVVERRSMAGELSLSYAWPVADGWPLMWVNHPL